MLCKYKHQAAALFFLMAGLFSAALPAAAQEEEEMDGEYWLKKGNSAYDRGYYDVAAAYYLKAAQYKLVDAQLYLGYAFYTGEGMDKDYASAVMWYKRAVAQGSHKAQYNLAYCYMYGNGVPASYDKALELLKASAEGGYEQAQRTLAECYQKGVLVEQDEARGKYWLERANKSAESDRATGTSSASRDKETDSEKMAAGTVATKPEPAKPVTAKQEAAKTETAEEAPRQAQDKEPGGALEIQFADDVEIEFADGTKKEAVKPVSQREEVQQVMESVNEGKAVVEEDSLIAKAEGKASDQDKEEVSPTKETMQSASAKEENRPAEGESAALADSHSKPRVILSPRMQQLKEEQQAQQQQEIASQPAEANKTPASASTVAPVVKILFPEDQSMFHTDRLPIMYQLIAGGLENETVLKVLVDGEEQPANRAVKKPNQIEVELPNHDCTVMMYAQNRNGNSVPTTIRLIRENVVQQELPRLYAVCIGVGTYDDPDLPNLKFTCKDATDFSEALMSKKGLPYADVQVKTLCDGEATRGDIFEALEWLRQETRPSDVCIFYYAGHGIRDEKDRFYFMPYGSSPSRLWDCFSADEFRKMAEDIDGKFIVFADACYSAALFEGSRSAAVNHFIEQLRRTKNGTMFYASSASDTKSKEAPNWKNGAFTKALVEAFHGAARRSTTDEGLSTHDLENYVYSEVKKMTEGRQTPIYKNVGGLEHFTLFIYE